MRIIIVEDEVRIREGIANLIGKFFPDHKVIGSAENGREGYECIRERCPDLVITDVKMPLMDGLEMLFKLYQDKLKCKAIVLSAYAEFSYAQQAMRWGVSEYLLKPLVVSELVQAVKNVEVMLAEEESSSPDILGRLEHILFGIIFGGMMVDDKLTPYLEEKYAFPSTGKIIEIQIYLGKYYDMQAERKREELAALLKRKAGIRYCILEVPREHMLLGILYGYEDEHDMERWFQQEILLRARRSGSGETCGYGWIAVDGIGELKSGYHLLSQHMDWNISLGDAVMISYPKILQVQTAICIYPIEIENQLRAAVCAYDYARTMGCMKRFKENFERGQIWQPKEIKESLVRFLWVMINVAKEIGAVRYERIEQQKILSRIMESVNREELWEIAEEVVQYITFSDEGVSESESLSYCVKRAESMIMEYYQSGITLDEIAAKLSITPEYLGMQFHKEKGVKFSAFIRDSRITKAKELLIGSSLKVWEIAEQVGYSDAKYFSRVFKENTGQLPAEYRKTYK